MKNQTYYWRKIAGLCPKCGEKPESGKVYCSDCSQYMRERNKDRAALLHSQGRCVCGAKRTDEHMLCASCRTRYRERYCLQKKKTATA